MAIGSILSLLLNEMGAFGNHIKPQVYQNKTFVEFTSNIQNDIDSINKKYNQDQLKGRPEKNSANVGRPYSTSA